MLTGQWNSLSLDFLNFLFSLFYLQLLENYEYANSNNHEEL